MKTLKELEMAVKIVEAIELYRKLGMYEMESADINKSNPRKYYHKHKIEIYAKCIERLKLRYKKLMNE